MGVSLTDLTGRKIGRLSVIDEAPFRIASDGKHRVRYWNCLCECGTRREVRQTSLAAGLTLSCGCLSRDSLHRVTHGMSGTPEYLAWENILQRCLNPNHASFSYYGGRGINVCPEWVASFDAFYDHVGDRPSEKHSIDRIDNSGNYEPGNVRWATKRQQTLNRRNTQLYEVEGVFLTATEWAAFSPASKRTVFRRLLNGWSIEEAVLTVPSPRGSPTQPTRVDQQSISALLADVAAAGVETHLSEQSTTNLTDFGP